MSLWTRRGRTLTGTAMLAGSALVAGVLTASPASAYATPGHGPTRGPDGLTLERLDRGLVAAVTGEGVFLSWRLLAPEVTGATATGLTGPDFAVYRDGVKVGTVTDSTSFVDPAGTATSRYRVAALVGGVEVDGTEATPWAQASLDIPLHKPADGVTPVGEAYTYSPTTCPWATSTATGSTSTSSSGTPPTPRTSARSGTPATSTSTPTSRTAPSCGGSTWA